MRQVLVDMTSARTLLVPLDGGALGGGLHHLGTSTDRDSLFQDGRGACAAAADAPTTDAVLGPWARDGLEALYARRAGLPRSLDADGVLSRRYALADARACGAALPLAGAAVCPLRPRGVRGGASWAVVCLSARG
jgi:hypothetical protein